jgi:hypothetical protein
MKATDPEAAIEEFLGVPALEQEKGDWGFKGLKQAIKLEFKLGQYDKVRICQLAFCRNTVTDQADRPLNITPNSSLMSKALLHETTPKNLSTIS